MECCSFCGVSSDEEYLALSIYEKAAICRKCIVIAGNLLKDCIEKDLPRIIGYEQLNFSANVWGI